MASTNRTGRVSAIDYEAGTYEVTYFDRGKSVTRQINAMSNGEYKMPCVGQVVSVAHNSNGTAAGTTTGTVWNKTNKPAEGYKGLYRKEYGTSRKGQAYSRYDENTGVYTQYVDKRTGRTCNGEIFDEAKGPVSVIAGGQLQLKSSGASASIFKSITFDNGTEFAAAEGLERSCVNKRLPRTKVYFCHPYSSWERGTNENTNGMIRRRFPKGTNFAAVTNAQIAQAENWINNYPRKILGYKSSEIVFRECLRELGIAA